MIEQQKTDPETAALYTAIESGKARPEWEEVALLPEGTKVLWWQWVRLAIRQGVLCRRWEAAIGNEVTWQVILPTHLRKQFIKQVHENMTGGHLGKAKTELQVSRRAY